MASAEIPVSVLVQIYAPLAGLLAVTFWLGVLSQRVKVAERRQDTTDTRLKALDDDKVEVGRKDEKLSHVERELGEIKRELHGIQRMLANMVSGKVGVITKFEQD